MAAVRASIGPLKRGKPSRAGALPKPLHVRRLYVPLRGDDGDRTGPQPKDGSGVVTKVAGPSPALRPGSPGPYRRAPGKHRRSRLAWSHASSWPARYIRSGRTGLRRGLRYLLVVFLLMLPPTAWSYTSAMLAPGSAPLSAKTVEWVSSHGGRGLVTLAETWWLNHHKPPIGGTPSGGIPTIAQDSPGPSVSPTAPPRSVLDHLPTPVDVVPIVSNPLPNEGVWQPLGRKVEGVPTMYISYFRPDKSTRAWSRPSCGWIRNC